MNYDRKALKLESKALIRAVRPKAWLVTLVFVLLAFALPQLVQSIFNPMRELAPQLLEDMADMVRRGREPDDLWVFAMLSQMIGSGMAVLFLSVFFSLFTMVMSYGYRGYALRVFRRQEAGVGTIFTGFPLAGRVIGTEIMTGIFVFLWTLLINLVTGLVTGLCNWLFAGVLGLEWLAAALTTVAAIASVVLCLLISLRYCLAPYFVMSDPDMGVFDAISASKATMRGHYVKKLVLDLSFLGWGLLVVLIIYLVVLMGAAVVLLTAGSQWLLELEEASHYMMTNQQAVEFALRGTADLVRTVMAPMGIVMLVAWLISLPLNLWLQAYQTVAEAGFFLTVTGQVLLVSGEEEPEAVSVPYDVPTVTDAPQAEMPETPEVPQEPEAPETPETPQEPEAPETPDVPETPDPEAPQE